MISEPIAGKLYTFLHPKTNEIVFDYYYKVCYKNMLYLKQDDNYNFYFMHPNGTLIAMAHCYISDQIFVVKEVV